VRNLDGQISPDFHYKLPADAAHLDSDGDSLLDSWETDGYDANGDNVVDVNLASLGCDRYQRDILLELDVMDNLQMAPPNQEVFDALRDMFRLAPILNPTTTDGINLSIDPSGKPCLRNAAGDQRCSFLKLIFNTPENIESTAVEPDPFATDEVWYSTLKSKNFQNDVRGQIFHYAIWGVEAGGDSSGESDYFDDFDVTFDTWGPTYETPRSRIEAIAHELGHDLGLHHAGAVDDPRYLPNYWSVMTYTWATRTGWSNDPETARQAYVTCLPFYYGVAHADEPGGQLPAQIGTHVSYSEGMAPTLASTSATWPLLCGKTVSSRTFGTATMRDHADWAALKFDGPAKNTSGIVP